MRGSELHQRYVDRITAIARDADTSENWRNSVETVIRQFHGETMPLMRAPYRKLRDEMAADFETKANMQQQGRAQQVFRLAADLIRCL